MTPDGMPTIDLAAEATTGLGEWALLALVVAGGLAFLVRGFVGRKSGACGGCGGCDKAGACPAAGAAGPVADEGSRRHG
ncbi:MAG: hypothetical protein ACOCYE_04520 [Pseudomonadota bacterium]